MNYSRPWMFAGLAMIAAGMALLCYRCFGEDATLPNNDKQSSPSPAIGNSQSGTSSCVKWVKRRNFRRHNKRFYPAQPSSSRQSQTDKSQWQELFDGRSLDGWKAPQFGGEGKVHVRDGMIVMEAGALMTGITWTGQPPRDNYELQLEGMRLSGSDFFATVTFPVGKEHCSFVVGGWGGALIGLSNVDYADASENSTTDSFAFADNQWYRIRVRVSAAAIEVWIDDKQVVKQPREEHVFGIRPEVEECRPLGISTWCTTGAVRNIRLRKLDENK